jgi:hypothetical protein
MNKLSEEELKRLKTDLEVKRVYLKYYQKSYESALADIRAIEKTINIIESGQRDLFDEFE